jgi:flagellar motility protein MotE (MotC chaperone)
MKPLRFLPLVALAATSLLLLKLAGLLLDGRGALTGTQVSQAKSASEPKPGEPPAAAGLKPAAAVSADPAKQGTEPSQGGGAGGAAETSPATGKAADAKTDGQDKAAESKADGKGKSAGAKADAQGKAAPKDVKPAGPPTDVESVLQAEHRTKGEIALLESLARRRQEIETREKELDLRLNLMKAAEQRVEEKIGTLKELQGKIEGAAKQEEQQKSEQYKQLVGLYSSMKPKDAARIFDELDNELLLGLMKEMKTQTMSAIFAAMNPAKTRSLTVAIANESKQTAADKPADELPRIEGQ